MSQSILLSAQSDVEKRKIEFLLKEVEQLKGAKVWRNGVAYSPKEAADHLRMKMVWEKDGRYVRKAEDFIEKIASKSAISKKPYMIQLENGSKIELKTFLYEKLTEWKE